MKSTDEATKEFVENLKNGMYEIPKEPDVGRKVELTDKYIEEQTEEFGKLLDSPIIQEILDFEPQKTKEKRI